VVQGKAQEARKSAQAANTVIPFDEEEGVNAVGTTDGF
jgi:hypothetical protein